MLHRIEPDKQLFAQLAGWNAAYPSLLSAWIAWAKPGHTSQWFADDTSAPSLVLVCTGNDVTLLSGGGDISQSLADLVTGQLEPTETWPDARMQQRWQAAADVRRTIQLNAHGLTAIDAALALGFEDVTEENEKPGGYYLQIKGEPRFAQLIKHACRVVDSGMELLELMKQATHYDDSGEYTQRCLESGPSFVCEPDGVPVCWACTHVNRMMGMIYTPPEYRRRGYARSLAAFQIDYMLRSDGLAACVVIATNEPSLSMMEAFEADRLEPPMYWRTLLWPENDP